MYFKEHCIHYLVSDLPERIISEEQGDNEHMCHCVSFDKITNARIQDKSHVIFTAGKRWK